MRLPITYYEKCAHPSLEYCKTHANQPPWPWTTESNQLPIYGLLCRTSAACNLTTPGMEHCEEDKSNQTSIHGIMCRTRANQLSQRWNTASNRIQIEGLSIKYCAKII